MMLRGVFFLFWVMLLEVAQGNEIKRQFPNLFRGGRRSEEEEEIKLAIQPVEGREVRRMAQPMRNNTFEEGFIRLDPDVWNQQEIEIQLFQKASRFRFRRQIIEDDLSNTNHFFQGTMIANNFESEEEDLVDSISLVQTKVTTSQISVVTGSIHVQGILYQIRQLPSGDLVVGRRGLDTEFDQEIEIEDDGTSNLEAAVWDSENKQELNNNNTLELDFPTDLRRLQQSDDGSRLDIMIVYTRNAMCAAARFANNKCDASSKNKATIEGIIELAVKETNEAFASSGIRTKLRLVKLHYEDQYDDTAHQWADVFSHFTGNTDGHMDYISAMRDQYGADFVSIIVNTRGFCGSAHRPSIPNADRAFSMVRWDCATGHYTFTHELAHTLGCRHDRESTQSDIEPGDFNFGFQHTKTRFNRFRTLMAYNCPDGGCQRILRFSNPSMSRQGIPFGTPKADNARFIRERLSVYANFRPSVVLTLPPPNPQLAAAPPASNAGGKHYSRRTQRLETVPYPGSLIGAPGNMFEVVAKKDLQIAGFSVTAFAATTATVEVYKLKNPGSFIGEEYNSDAWTLIGSATLETLENKPTALPPGTISRVIVKQGTTQAFYVTFQADTNYNRYSRASRYGEIFAENDDIQFKVGYTASYPFAYHPKAPRVFNGEIFYESLKETIRPPVAPTPTSALALGSIDPSGLPELGPDTKVFETTFASNNGYAGNLFTIQSKADIVLETFDVNAINELGLELKIFTKFGDFDRNDGDPSANWIEICSTRVNGRGESVPTHVPAQAVKSIAIKANAQQSFYITFNGPFMRYTSALLDPNYLGNEHLALVASAGTQFPFKNYFANRIWNGKIYYRTGLEGADMQGGDTSVAPLPEEKPRSGSYGAVAGRTRKPP